MQTRLKAIDSVEDGNARQSDSVMYTQRGGVYNDSVQSQGALSREYHSTFLLPSGMVLAKDNDSNERCTPDSSTEKAAKQRVMHSGGIVQPSNLSQFDTATMEHILADVVATGNQADNAAPHHSMMHVGEVENIN